METLDPGNVLRYQRQVRLPQLGESAQWRLGESRVLIVGCGAIGSVVAEQLARAGIGFIRIADRDIVELTNLQRQVLFDESDAREAAPKSVAAARRLRQINSSIRIDAHVVDVGPDNIERLADVDLIIDGTDNVETRYVINDFSVRDGRPWIYGGCVGAEGRVLTIHPPESACLRCIFPNPPDPANLATCETAGVLGPAAAVVGAMQAVAAIKILSGNADSVAPELLTFDLWDNRIRSVCVRDAKRADCPTCGLRRFEFLENAKRDFTTRLCGRNAVQIRPARTQSGFSLDALAMRLASVGEVRKTDDLVRVWIEGNTNLTVFADGRAIVQGTADFGRARSLYARLVGS